MIILYMEREKGVVEALALEVVHKEETKIVGEMFDESSRLWDRAKGCGCAQCEKDAVVYEHKVEDELYRLQYSPSQDHEEAMLANKIGKREFEDDWHSPIG